MNALLKHTLDDRADEAPAPYVDTAALVAAGRKRVHRRRVGAGVGALALVAAAAVATPFVIGGDASSEQGRVASDTGPFTEPAVSWSDGTVVHVGDETVDLGVRPQAYVLTEGGVVFADPDGGVWLADGSGESEQIGATAQPYGTLLVADGPYAGWYDNAAGAFVGYDAVTRTEVARVAASTTGEEGEFEIPMVRAIDGAGMWVWADGSARELDLGSGGADRRAVTLDRYNRLADAGGGRYAVEEESGRRLSIEGGEAPAAEVPGDGRADLSPDAAYVATDPNDSEQVWDVATGEDVTPDIGDYDVQAVVQWLDADRYQAIVTTNQVGGGDDGVGPLDFLVCSVSAGSCEVAATDVGELGDVQLPVGENLSD